MSEEPDMNFDIDALFEHKVNNLGYDFKEEEDWHFRLRSSELQQLEDVANELQQEFMIHLQEHVEEIDAEGNSSLGPPMLSLVKRGVFTADEVKQLVERVSTIAKKRSLVYEGVSCYAAIDEEEIFGWLAPDDACWRLRHMTDCGLEIGEELPWAFLILTSDFESTIKIAKELDANGFKDHDEYDEPDEEGMYGLCLYIPGRNDEHKLMETGEKIIQVADKYSGLLEGIQFYTREDVDELFGDGHVDSSI